MAVGQVSAGRDKLERYARSGAVEALAEVIWNALDAEADLIKVEFDTSRSLSPGTGAEAISRISVIDNGHGMPHERAQTEFLSHGDSWKRGLGGRTKNQERVLHGRQGRGRFLAYALGANRVTWTSVYREGEEHHRVRIVGDRNRINEFDIKEPVATESSVGTRVVIEPSQEAKLGALLRDDLHIKLASTFAPHLLGNPDITILVNGKALDPGPLIDKGPYDLDLPEIDGNHLHGQGPPKLRIIEWTDLVRPQTTLVLCNAGGAALHEVDAADAPKPRPGVKLTGFAHWDGFASEAIDTAFAHMRFPDVFEALKTRLADHIRESYERQRLHVVDQLKKEKVYPYAREPVSPLEKVERTLFDAVLVAAEPALGNTTKEKKLSTRLLKLAVTERPETLDSLLEEVLMLEPEVRDSLAALIKQTSFASLIRVMHQVTDRLDLLAGLRELIYGDDLSKRMTEITQLHPLVEENCWLFGDYWGLSRSETSLTNVLREIVGHALLEEDLVAGHVRRLDGRTGRVDLLLQRRKRTKTGFDQLVVELKRPSTTLTRVDADQVKEYADALTTSASGSAESWEFWLVGSRTDEALDRDRHQADRDPGILHKGENYAIRVVQWGELIEERLLALDYIQSQLEDEGSQQDSLDRLRERFGHLIPRPTKE